MNYKKLFPTLTQNPKLVYLDSGASTQTPTSVLSTQNQYYEKFRSNVHRGVYSLSIDATAAYEQARQKIAKFLNAQATEIIYTPGTTFGLNQLAYSLSPRLSHRDNVVLTRMEHHANLVPWQQMAKHYGFSLRFIELNPDYTLDLKSAAKLIDENTKILSFTFVSNVLGTINPARKLNALAREKNPKIYTIVDAAQAAAHLPIDVKKLDCDFLALSGHKMYGPTGIGVLYGKKVILEEHLEPFLFGGDMVSHVEFNRADWNELPYKFEAGTPNISGAIGLGAAVDFINKIGFKTLLKHELKLQTELLKGLAFAKVKIIGPLNNQGRVGVVSFAEPKIHPHDFADILNQQNICVRAGFHCAEPLVRSLGYTGGTTRASLAIYNTEADVAALVSAVVKAKKIFRC